MKTNSEHHVELNSVKSEITAAKKLYADFAEDFSGILDLSRPESILTAYEEAVKRNIFTEAEKIRNLIFGKDMYFYGVVYTSDFCANNCAYCPGGKDNRAKAIASGIVYPRKALTEKQIISETLAVLKAGHSHICYLEGSPSEEVLANGSYAKKISKYVEKIICETKGKGLEEIILNIEPLSEEGFKEIVAATKKANEKKETTVAIQFRVFQETYDKVSYEKVHDARGPKGNYERRLNSQARALRAGFNKIGMGALLGLNRYPMEEIAGLVKHTEEIYKEFSVLPARICLPSANELHGLKTYIPYVLETGETRPTKEGEGFGEFKMGVYEKCNELIYALARLAMPEINLVSSERDTPAMLRILNKYATCTTLGVRAGVGGNCNFSIEEISSKKEVTEYVATKGAKATFLQATTFPRNVSETINEMLEDGYSPIFKM